VEQLPSVAARYARKTQRLAEYQTHLACFLGGRPGERFAKQQNIAVSHDTLIRFIRNAPEIEHPTPRVMGVDDWAQRKGQRYGTILVDLETHSPVDLLPERSADTLAIWLQEHPGVEIISRDRSNEYSKGAAEGAPEAIQIADRWHLMKNMREAVERYLEHNQGCLVAAGQVVAPAKNAPEENQVTTPAQTKQEQERLLKREKRLRRYQAVRQFHQQGLSQREIVRRMGMSRETVCKYLKSDVLPEYPQRKKQPGILDPYRDHLEKRWQDGLHNASALWRELCEQGYSGERGMVGLWAAEKRMQKRKLHKSKESEIFPFISGKWSSNRAAWLLLQDETQLSKAEQEALQRMHQAQPELVMVQELAQDFFTMIRQRQSEALSPWLERAEKSKIAVLDGFCKGIHQDLAAVQSALFFEWSNGQTEGQVNRLKNLKRQMYGRANFDLLRKRFLGLPNPP